MAPTVFGAINCRTNKRLESQTNDRKYLQHFGEPSFVGQGLKLLVQKREKVPQTLFGSRICRNNKRATTNEV